MVFVMRTRGQAARWGTSAVASALFATLLVFAPASLRGGDTLEASAATTYHCSGYSGCVGAGYSDAGYGAVSSKMYWRMYSGHNCTNYAAYRVIKAGGPANRPWSGGGNASEWGLRMANITDQVPNVGAIAWWGRYSNGSGSAGHVAYVERVVSSTEIVISEDSWGGTFHWRTILKSSGRWPTGFIHFVDKTVAAKTAPTVEGTPTVGKPLTATGGTWSVTPTSLAYTWLVDGVSTGVTTPTYTPKAADFGKAVTVKVRARRTGYSDGEQTSAPTPAVAKGLFAVVEPPVVAGTPYVDEVLTATTGTWTPAPKVLAWRWYANGVRIPNNDTDKLPLTPALVGKTITMIPAVRQDGYRNAVAPTVAVGQVLMGSIELAQPSKILGLQRVGTTLRVAAGPSTPADVTTTQRWFRDGVPIVGATATSYVLTGADTGRKITVTVNRTRKNYAPMVETVARPGVVMSPAKITAATSVRKKTVVVDVLVTAVGVTPVNGQVAIRVGNWNDTVRLVNGRAKVSVLVGSRGRKDIAVRYLGSPSVVAGRIARSVTVR